MTDEVIKETPEVEENSTHEAPAEETVETTEAPAEAEETVGDIVDEATPTQEPEKIELSKFIELKRQNKELVKEIKKAQDSGQSKAEVSADIKSLASEYDVDPAFLEKLSKSVKAEAKAEFDEVVAKTIKPIEEKQRKEQIDNKFKKVFDKTLDKMPEYSEVVNPEVIKALAMSPDNAKKTMTQLIEEAYGNSVGGAKHTAETNSRPTGGKEPGEVDIARARKDPEYFKQVMADPVSKAKYNEELHKRI